MNVSSALLGNVQKTTVRLWQWLRSASSQGHDPCPWCPARVEFTGEPPRDATEALIAKIARGHRSLSFHWLQDQIAENLYRTKLRQAGWVLDIGVWGPAAFREEAGHILAGLRPEFGFYALEGEYSQTTEIWENPAEIAASAISRSGSWEERSVATSEQELRVEGLKAELQKEARKAKLNLDQLKSGGFIKQTQKDLFTVRLRCPAGLVTSEKLRVAAGIADRYGRGEVHLTVRQSVEVPYVSYHDFDAIVEELKAANWSVASCGPRARVPTACSGCSYNPNGLTNTQEVCLEVDRRYFGAPTGLHKFKVSFSGCPIDCFRTREMDLGFQGMVEPELLHEICNGCELCVRNCEDHALQMEGGLPVRDPDKCIGCGDCVKICPVDAMVVAHRGWLVRVGGKHGKHPLFAYEVASLVSDEGVYSLMERTLQWYRENGQGRERVGATIARVGLERYIAEVVKPLGLVAIDKSEERRKFRSGGNFYE